MTDLGESPPPIGPEPSPEPDEAPAEAPGARSSSGRYPLAIGVVIAMSLGPLLVLPWATGIDVTIRYTVWILLILLSPAVGGEIAGLRGTRAYLVLLGVVALIVGGLYLIALSIVRGLA